MRISDWSSDVCSSDLIEIVSGAGLHAADGQQGYSHSSTRASSAQARVGVATTALPQARGCASGGGGAQFGLSADRRQGNGPTLIHIVRSAVRRVGEEGVGTGRSRRVWVVLTKKYR